MLGLISDTCAKSTFELFEVEQLAQRDHLASAMLALLHLQPYDAKHLGTFPRALITSLGRQCTACWVVESAEIPLFLS